MSNLFVILPPKQTVKFKAICLESGYAPQVFYPAGGGQGARRVEVKASAEDFEALKGIFAEDFGTAIL